MEHSPRYAAHLANSREASPSDCSPCPTPPAQFSPPPSPVHDMDWSADPKQRRGSGDRCLVIETPGVIVCRNWSATGRCRFGSGCHFAATHTAANYRPPQSSPPSSPPVAMAPSTTPAKPGVYMYNGEGARETELGSATQLGESEQHARLIWQMQQFALQTQALQVAQHHGREVEAMRAQGGVPGQY